MATKILHSKATNSLASLAPMLHHAVVPRTQDVLDKIGAKIVLDAKRLREIKGESAALFEAYQKYTDLEKERKARESSITSLVALLGKEGLEELRTRVVSANLLGEFDFGVGIETRREELSLWEFIAQYLRFVQEAKVADIEYFLGEQQMQTTRQAIESAVKTHSKIFRVRKRGREKFISLR